MCLFSSRPNAGLGFFLYSAESTRLTNFVDSFGMFVIDHFGSTFISSNLSSNFRFFLKMSLTSTTQVFSDQSFPESEFVFPSFNFFALHLNTVPQPSCLSTALSVFFAQFPPPPTGVLFGLSSSSDVRS
jgi:hypothetical protein